MNSYDELDRDMPVDVLGLLFRLFRLAKMHDLDNEASRKALERAVEQLSDFLGAQLRFISVLFAGETIYVNGHPLRAEKTAYENALTVGAVLDSLGYNELTIREGITGGDVHTLLRYVADGEVHGGMPKTLRLRVVDPKTVIGADEEEASIGEQVTGTYSAAIVLCRRFNEGVAEDDFTLLRHIKRVSQRLVTLSSGGFLEWLALVRRPIPPTDRARHAVHAAIIGVLAGRALTRDMHALLRIAMACLKGDVGRPRVVGMYRQDAFGGGIVPAPNETMRRRMPSSAAALLLQTGRVSPPALRRTVVAYEAIHLSDSRLLGWPYAQRIAPTVEGIIAAVAMRMGRALAEASGPDEMVRDMLAVEMGKVERATIELCWSILGIIPRGTPVEMESGDFGVVTSAGRDFFGVEHQEVVVLQGAGGMPVDPFKLWAGGEWGWVKRVIQEPDPALLRAYDDYKAAVSIDERADVTLTRLPSDDDSIDSQSTLVFNPDDVSGPEAPEFLKAIWDE